MKESYLFLAHGFEEVEALTAVDLLRRAGMPLKMVSITGTHKVMGAHNIEVMADCLFADVVFDDPAWLILPGGMPGAENLYNFESLRALVEKQMASPHGRVAAICAAPAVVLGQMGLLAGKPATCYPGFELLCKDAMMEDTPVVATDKYVLGNGPANAMAWALRIIAEDRGGQNAKAVADGLLYNPTDDARVAFTFG